MFSQGSSTAEHKSNATTFFARNMSRRYRKFSRICFYNAPTMCPIFLPGLSISRVLFSDIKLLKFESTECVNLTLPFFFLLSSKCFFFNQIAVSVFRRKDPDRFYKSFASGQRLIFKDEQRMKEKVGLLINIFRVFPQRNNKTLYYCNIFLGIEFSYEVKFLATDIIWS